MGRWLLGPLAGRWLAAREAHCDRHAVIRGADPLSLADALLTAARPTRLETVALGASDTSVLKLRVNLLLAFADRRPVACCGHGRWAVSSVGLMLVFVSCLPHHTGTQALDVVHTGTEHAFNYVWAGR